MMIKKRLKWYKQVAFTAQVSKHGIKTSKIIHVNGPRLPCKPKAAETIPEFRIYVQEAIERHERYKLHCCRSTLSRTFLSSGIMLPAPYEEASQIVIDGRMNEFINSQSLVADDASEQQQLKVVSVIGSGCLGKTTLAKVLYNRIGVQFDCRAFIRASKKPDMKTLFCDLFSQLHQKKQPLPANCNELDISDNTSKHLQDKRYLIIIDDLWDASVWDILKYAFPKGNHGSRIIITTQIEDVALTCCCDDLENVFEMKPLDDDHSRKLFFNRLFGSENDCPVEFKQVSNAIIDICGGLPLATINIASHLANQQTAVSLDSLTYICDSLRSHLWSSSTLERTSQVLNLSYNNLPHHLKTCLLYLHMYPDGSIVWKNDLVKQWVAEGFIVTGEGKEQDQEMIEKTSGIYFDALIDRRFIQALYVNYNNEVLSCTVHDVVRHLIAHKSAEENFIVVGDSNRKNIALSHKVRRLSLAFGDAKYAKTPANIIKSQLRSLRFFGLFECMPCIREFKILRVLYIQLSGHNGDHNPIDLTGISELYHLRYLKIVSEVCIKLPNCMQGLQFLETLDIMEATRVISVPRDIIHLPHLLHLTLPVDTNLLDWLGSSMSDSVISLWSLGKLNYLKDLRLNMSCTPPFLGMRALGNLIGGHGNLKTIILACGSSVKNTVVHGTPRLAIPWDLMAPPTFLQRFECSPHSYITFHQIPKWVTKLGNLCILKTVVRELPLSSVDILRGLPALTALSLYVETAPLEKIIFYKAGFSVLKHFKLRFTSGIAWLQFEANAMPNLLNLKLVFDAVPRMDQHLIISSNQAPFEAYQHGTALISIEHMLGLKEIAAKFGGAAADIEYALRIGISNHPSNPTINGQLVDYSSYGDKRAKQKHRPDEVLEGKPDEYNMTMEIPTDERISSKSPESCSWLHVPAGILRMKELLIACATAVEDDKYTNSSFSIISKMIVAELRRMVSVCGDPLQRLGAYMLEGLLARIYSSGYSVCQALECNVEDFISYRNFMYKSCPYLVFGRTSANGAIAEAMKGEDRIHIIDFCISDGCQWVTLLQALAARPGGAPAVRITCIDDSVPAYARGSSNLELVWSRLSHIAGAINLPFEFHALSISASQLEEDHLCVVPGEPVAVNFNLGLHKISDDDDDGSSLSQRDRILRLVKSLSPRVVTLVEKELNTNDTTTFAQRFTETLDYYTTLFESIDVALPRDGRMRIKMEQHCLGKEMVNLIACEGVERVERHELFSQWKARLIKAGFTPSPLSSLVNDTIKTMLQSYSPYYRFEERDGVLYLGWKDRPMVVTSAWH